MFTGRLDATTSDPVQAARAVACALRQDSSTAESATNADDADDADEEARTKARAKAFAFLDLQHANAKGREKTKGPSTALLWSWLEEQ